MDGHSNSSNKHDKEKAVISEFDGFIPNSYTVWHHIRRWSEHAEINYNQKTALTNKN
jgi:hypothetical protein